MPPQFTRRTALTVGGAGVAASLLAACGGSGETATTTTVTGSTAPTIFGANAGFRFAVISHAIDDAFFVPLQYGVADACELLGCSYDWAGSASNNATQEIEAIDTAVSAGVDGIATTIIESEAFEAPIAAALAHGIPVISYNADAAQTSSLAYIGQNLEASGKLMAEQILAVLPDGGKVALFVSTPGLPDVEPRVRGLRAALKQTDVKLTVAGSGAASAEQDHVINAFITANSDFNGFFGADQGSTLTVGNTIQNGNLAAKGIVGGGFDPNIEIEQLIASGDLAFAIDQQPYLQGFLAIVQLYLYKVSNGLTGPADVDTGLKLITKQNVTPYVKTVSRFEGSSSSAGVQAS